MAVARLVNGVVVELLDPTPGRYPEALIELCVPAPAEVGISWRYDGAEFAPPVAPPPTVTDLLQHAAAQRYIAETRGITVDGVAVASDRTSQAMLTAAVAYLQSSGAPSVAFKGLGGFVMLTAAQVTAIALAVGAHVQSCFATEAALVAGIRAEPPTVTTLAQIDAAFAA
ncbi:DUF4376 domain-containing protein [Methylobacterium nodulans]|uniref:DUF4376 domain-containing protein n=1 Tax=Methylobacterium nodulans (strain LMG 21967 / CNCM I-2342 / ORS 2060) TaxID=460265 RepID=B8ICK0_METNO|nr:DUF4376 domain-containing protein [Methylobacterium nodulans]ACL57411.1 hypothetical protein Mnod_2441 [Methylobacterium nodulans ORS 2060]